VTEQYTFQGTEQYYNLAYSPLRDEHGQVNGVVSFERNVTETIAAKHHTEQLLREAKDHTEELKAQEEELRQNMEELTATQEEMHRILKEVQEKENFVTGLINATHDLVIAIDADRNISAYNDAVTAFYKGYGVEVKKGMPIMALFEEGEQQTKFTKFYDRAFAGESFEVTEHYVFQGEEQYYAITYSPLKDEEGRVNGVVSFEKNITETMLAKQQTEKLLAEVQANAEALQAQEYFTAGLLNATKDVIVSIDLDYKITSFNQSMATLYKGSGIEITRGMDVLSIYGDDAQRVQFKSYYERAFAGESFDVTQHYSYRGKDFYMIIHFSPLYDLQGNVIGAVRFEKDVTDREEANIRTQQLLKESKEQSEELKTQEEELRQNMEELSATQDKIHQMLQEVETKERMMKNIMDISSESIVTLDREFKVVNFNKIFSQPIVSRGFPLDKGLEFFAIIPPKMHAEKKKILQRVLKGETIEIIDEVVGPEGSRQFLVKHAPLIEPDGSIQTIAIFSKDLSEVKKLQTNVSELS
jgi:PAS domain S-box-containing protein